MREAVELEHEFCCEALSCALVGMNAKLMGQYIDYVADRLLVALGYEKLYNTANPFDWMEMISLQVPLSATSLSCKKTSIVHSNDWEVAGDWSSPVMAGEMANLLLLYLGIVT